MRYFVLILTLLFNGCIGVKETNSITLHEPKANYEEKSIILSYESSNNINYFNGSPHSLSIFVFQLSDVQKFDMLSRTSSGVEKMIKSNINDPTFIIYNRYTIMPNESKTIYIDRHTGAKYVGIVAAFFEYSTIKDTVWRENIPIVTEDEKSENDDSYLWFFGKKDTKIERKQRYGNANIELKIDKDSIDAHIKENGFINLKDVNLRDTYRNTKEISNELGNLKDIKKGF